MVIIYSLIALIGSLFWGVNYFSTSYEIFDIGINVFFLNGLVPTAANNYVVRGGWFVGTAMIFYLITPLAFKIYFLENKIWEKIRFWLFPLVVTFACVGALIVFGSLDERFLCRNNSFIYFSFVNQAPAYFLGFTLYELYKKNKFECIKLALLKGIIALAISIFLFYINWKYSFVLCPIFVAIAGMYCCISISKIRNVVTSKCGVLFSKAVRSFGTNSFAIYLTHPLIVFPYARLIKELGKNASFLNNYILILLLLLPCVVVISYGLGRLFSIYLSVFDKLRRRKR